MDYDEFELTEEDGIEYLAKVAFDAYGVSKGGLTYDGKKIPEYSEVGADVQKAWEAAVIAVLNEIMPPQMAEVEYLEPISYEEYEKVYMEIHTKLGYGLDTRFLATLDGWLRLQGV